MKISRVSCDKVTAGTGVTAAVAAAADDDDDDVDDDGR